MSKNIPVYKGTGFFKRNAEFFTDSLNFTMRNLEEIGDFYYSNMMMRDYYITSNPEVVKHVLVDNQKNYIKSPAYQTLKLIIGNGLLTSEGDFWRKQRRLAQPAFYKGQLEALFYVMQNITLDFCGKLSQKCKEEKHLDVAEEMNKLTADIVLKTLFTAENDNDQTEMYNAVGAAQEFVVFCMQNPHLVPLTYLNGKRKKFHKNKALFDQAIFKIIESRRVNKTNTPDLLNMLMGVQDADTGEVMSNQQLRDEIMTMYAAGHETSANSLSWTLYLLAQHPEVVEQLRAEAQFVIGNEVCPSFVDIRRLQYTKQVIEESMRLFPPAWSLGRENLEDDKILDYNIPKGSIIFISNYTLHRDPRFWDNPENFNPDRFDPELTKARPRMHYLPFGAGPRMCIGNHFAMMEMQLILSTLINNFDFELVTEQEVVPQALVTLKPKFGIKMKVRELVPV